MYSQTSPTTPFSDDKLSSPATPNRKKSFGNSSTPDMLPEFQHDVPRWSPSILGIIPMSLFAVLLVLLIVGLEMLNTHSPYNAPSSSMQFFWTYFPVGFLMVVEWIWGVYDLQVKVLVPWASMSRGFTPASRGWLLDYVGGNYFLSIWTAIRFRHIVVLLAKLGLWSTAIAGIVTTSLFQLQDVSHTSPTTFTRTTTLDPSAFTPSLLSDRSYLNSFLGRRVLSLSPARWTAADSIAMEAFTDPSPGLTTGTLMAQTRGYSADLDCTAAAVSYGGNMSIPGVDPDIPQAWSFLINVVGKECEQTFNLTNTNTDNDVFGDQTYFYGRVYNHTCPGSSNYTTILAMATMSNFGFVSATGMECSPSYFQHTLSVSVPASSSPLTASVVRGSTEAFPAPEWAGILQWINSTNGMDRDIGPAISFEQDPWEIWGNNAISGTCDCDPWFYLVGHAQNVTQVQLMDAGTLLNTSRVSFAEVWMDLAQSLLMTQDHSSASLPGNVTIIIKQLVARPTSVRIAQAALAVLLAVTLAVYFLQPRPNLPMDPSSIAAQAFLLRNSHEEISTVIKDTATMSAQETEVALQDCQFAVVNQRHFLITSRRGEEKARMPPSFTPGIPWRPTILHPLFKGFLGLVLVATIIALELALRRSMAKNGFTDFNSNDQHSWTYLPPAYLFVLGIFLSSYTFSISTLEPFFAMAESPQPAGKSVRYSPAHRTSIGLVFHALKYRSLVGIACATIMLTVPFLKITVSGLITTAPAPVQDAAQITLNTMFNTTTIFYLPDDEDTAAKQSLPGQTLALSQIPNYNLALPVWTTLVGAIGHVDLGELGQLTTAPNTTVTMPLPVMRGDLENCTALTGADLNLLPSNELQLPLPPTTDGPDGNRVCVFNYDLTEDTPEKVAITLPASPGWFGQVYHPTCGGYVLIFGTTHAANASIIDKLTAVQCTIYSLTMSTQNVTLQYDGGNVEILSIAPSRLDTIQMSSFPVNESGYLTAGGFGSASFESNASLAFDPFMQIITMRDAATPLDAYLDPATLTSAAQALYTAYWSVFAALNLVIPVNVNRSQPVEALVSYSRTRIVQAQVPTRILEALLAAVLACGLLTALVVRRTHGVLTKAPYSIGAIMGLLADSAFVELEGLRSVKREEDLDTLLEPYAFRLGWGNNTQGGNRFGIDLEPR
ncbi:hypothetical protein B0H17DRAFT_1184527 [Mycena rosella]|uniref:Uncharacterized protein n=1 Tax=Mycena rosella TaxID=1033263 RepID=A0AAD7CVE3_MYCRO|nr:hypothetical protein B0H17DRAFT_1184527 [Mycena rosella]